MARRASHRRVAIMNRVSQPNLTLPAYLVLFIQESDLKLAFDIFDTENTGTIFLNNAKNILWNFGFNKVNSKQFDTILTNLDIDSRKPFLDFNQLTSIMASRYYSGGKQQDIEQMFKIFDKRDRGVASANDIKESLTKLKIPFHEGEVEELLATCGIDPSHPFDFQDFSKMMSMLKYT